MSPEQAAIFLLLAGMLVVFALDRFRTELVALGGLALALLLGLVEPSEAFAGLSHPAFLTVLEVLLIVPVLGRSGILDPLSRRIPRIARSRTGVVAVLCSTTAAISVFMNNIGALALMLPVAASVCRIADIDQRRVLMPLSFAALLGGMCSIIGTPANLIVSNQLAAATGRGFAFFDFAWVGVPATAAGLLMLVLRSRRGADSGEVAVRRPPPQALRRVVAEIEIPPGSPLAGVPLADIDARVHGLRRGGANQLFQRAGFRSEAGDVLVVSVDLPQLEAWLKSGRALLPDAPDAMPGSDRVEAVVMPESLLVGSRIGTLASLHARGIRVLAVALRTPRIEGSFADLQLSIGDVLYLAGEAQAIDDAVEEAEILPLRSAAAQDGAVAARWFPAVVFAAGIAAAAFGLLALPLAFGAVTLVLAARGDLNLRKGLAELDWPILIMLATMLPLGEAVEATGAAEVLARMLVGVLPWQGPLALALTLLLLAVAITPFVNNASTAIVLGPIAIGMAAGAGVDPAPLLIAVALGSSIDFLTPIGHHNNTVVMGLGGYRFLDFIKAGWPVTLAVVLVSALGLSVVWGG